MNVRVCVRNQHFVPHYNGFCLGRYVHKACASLLIELNDTYFAQILLCFSLLLSFRLCSIVVKWFLRYFSTIALETCACMSSIYFSACLRELAELKYESACCLLKIFLSVWITRRFAYLSQKNHTTIDAKSIKWEKNPSADPMIWMTLRLLFVLYVFLGMNKMFH